ncbi:MAG TPA: ABC transporter permease [Puia sp.]|nr:ABC transporter permease [Puia sp.]
MIRNYLKPAWRSLRRNPQVTMLNIAGLTIGMTAVVLIFLWVQNERGFDRYQPDSDHLYSLNTRLTSLDLSWEGAPMLLAPAAKLEVPGILRVTRLNTDNRPIFAIGDRVEYEKNCAYVDPNWFSLFSYHFIDGNAGGFGQDTHSVILTTSAAKKYFGSRPAIGETIRIDSARFRVTGVVADPPPNSSFQYQAYLPIAVLQTNAERRQHDEDWSNTDYRTFVQIAAGVSPQTIAADLTKVLQRGSHDDQGVLRAELAPLKDLHFDNSHSDTIFAHGNAQVVTIFSVLGILILLVACINYVNLTTAKASLRTKEVSIRKIVGAARRQLFLQFVAESVLVSILSAGAALLVVRFCLPVFGQLTGRDFSGAFNGGLIWAVTGCIVAAAFVLNSIYPALLLSAFRPLNIFRGVTVLKLKDVYLRKGLVVVQFTLAILLVTASLVIERQLHYIQSTDPGYDRSQVLMVNFPNHVDPTRQSANVAHTVEAIRQQLLAHSGIEAVSLASQPVVNIGSRTSNGDWDGKDTSFKPNFGQLSADAGLQQLLRLSLVSGRWFRAGDAADEANVVLNETAIKALHIRQPVLGARFTLHGVRGQVIGIVKDFHFRSLREKTGPLVIFNNPGWWQYFFIKTAPQSAAPAVAAVQEIWQRHFPGVPLEYNFMDERFDNLYRQDAITSKLILVFTFVAVMISALGLFGLAAFAAERRRREIGIRKVLGASTMRIGALLSREFLRLVIIAIVLATPLAWWAASSWLQGFAYRTPLSWWMFAISWALTMAMALLITGWHALRAARVNPVKSLSLER